MDDIYNKNYAAFMEDTLKSMVQLPVEGICVVTKLKDGAVYASFFNSTVMDNITYAGVIQQDAMLEMLKNNGYVTDPKEDPEQ